MKILYANGNKRKKKKRVLPVLLFLLFLTGIGYFCLSQSYEIFKKQQYPLAYQDIIEKEAKENGLEPALVYAVAKAESNFDEDAKSRAGAMGLMQITPKTFQWLQTKLPGQAVMDEKALLDPKINVKYGCYLLALLKTLYTDQTTVLCAYNAGIGSVDRWLADRSVSPDGVKLNKIPYPETAHYAKAVMENYRIYQELYEF